MKKLIYILSVAALLNSCKKTDFEGIRPTGEGLVDFTLIAPVSGTALILNAATPDAPVNFSWNAAKPGLNTAPSYKIVAVVKGGDLDNPLLSFDVPGSATSMALTQKQIDDALKAKSITDGVATELTWSIKASNGSVSILSQSIFNIKITRMKDGATPFVLLGPTSSSANVEINPGSASDKFIFNWTKSKPAATANAIKYKVWFYVDDANMAPVFSASSDNSGSDSTYTVSWKGFSDSLVNHGYTDFSSISKLKWKVVATSGTWDQPSDYINQLYVVRLVRMYLVGSITGWNIDAPWEIVADKADSRLGKVFYTYIKLNVGDEFKFVKEVGNWGSCYGDNGVSGAGYATGYNVGGNFKIATAGIYRLTVDLGTNMAYVQQKQVGVVGNMQGWNPGSPIYGGLVGRDRFLIIANSSGSDEFKFHDGPVWDNSSPANARWWGKGSAAGTLDTDGNGTGLVANTSPRTRAIWDATNPQQVKYNLSAAAEMRLVGDGINQAGVGDWSPGTSPQMAYSGNGIWTITITLKADKDIKFLAGNDWGAFDYEDNSGQSNAVGTAKAIKWDGDKNFKTPAVAGTYTITLDEYTQTVTIN